MNLGSKRMYYFCPHFFQLIEEGKQIFHATIKNTLVKFSLSSVLSLPNKQKVIPTRLFHFVIMGKMKFLVPFCNSTTCFKIALSHWHCSSAYCISQHTDQYRLFFVRSSYLQRFTQIESEVQTWKLLFWILETFM